MNKLIRILVLSSLFILCFSCRERSIVAEVGPHQISKQDAHYRDRVLKVYYPKERRNLGLKQLVRTYTAVEVLKKHGHEITPEKLEKESHRIDTQVKQPRLLAKIKDVFGDDREAYMKIYVLPQYVDRVLYEKAKAHHQDPSRWSEWIEKEKSLIQTNVYS